MTTLRALLDRRSLRRHAGERAFGRGESYSTLGRVRAVTEDEDKQGLSATVEGEREYAVRLWVEDDALRHSCDCTVGESGAFCKHCVAAGLVYAERETYATIQAASSEPNSTATEEDLRAYLLAQDKETLVGLLQRQIQADRGLRERLLARAARDLGKGLHLRPYLEAIDAATVTNGLVEYRQMRSYVEGIYRVVGMLYDLLDQGYAAETLSLVEHFRKVADEQTAMVDDSDGGLGGVLHALRDLHHDACLRLRPDPETLAGQLLDWQLADEYSVWTDAIEQYADVLGEVGLATYRRLLESRWVGVPFQGPGQFDEIGDKGEIDDAWHRRYYWHGIQNLMERLERQAGDVEALAAVLARDLSHPYAYLQIATAYQEAAKPDQALAWAERGLRDHPHRPDSRLRDFVAEAYHRAGRHAEAMELAWSEFLASPELSEYRKLKAHAETAGDWPRWRERALEHIRERLTRAPDRSVLVSIYLWEGDGEAAWREAQEGGCSRGLWLELAARREGEHPEEALPIYQREVEPAVETKGYDGYVRAADYLRKVKALLVRLGREEEFAPYLAEVRARHRRKRNFQALTADL